MSTTGVNRAAQTSVSFSTWSVHSLLSLISHRYIIKSIQTMAQFEEVKVHGYDEFCQAVSDRKGKDIFAYFSGDKDAQGVSWCPDCVKGKL